MAEALAEVMTEGAFINGALIGISENRHVNYSVWGMSKIMASYYNKFRTSRFASISGFPIKTSPLFREPVPRLWSSRQGESDRRGPDPNFRRETRSKATCDGFQKSLLTPH